MGRSIDCLIKPIIICISMLFTLNAMGATVGLVVDAPSKQIALFQKQLQILSPNDNIQVISLSQLTQTQTFDKWITLGPNALGQLLSRSNALNSPVLALFLPSDTRVQLSVKHKQGFTTLDNTPSLEKQLSLIKALVPHAQKVGVYYSSQFSIDKDTLSRIAAKQALELHWAELKDPLDWDRHALKVLGDVDLVLGVNDDALYNTTTIRSILMRLYRSGKALIGPDKGYVRAGAVASVYSGIEETLKAAASWISSENATETLYKNPYFNISVNSQVARSLNIVVDEVDVLVKQVQEDTNEK